MMNSLKYFLKSINIGSTNVIFSLLIISFIIHVSAWAANYKFGTFLEFQGHPKFYNMLYHGRWRLF